MVLAVNTAEVATPEALVTAVFTPPANVPEAPLLGAVKVTVTPLTGCPVELVTVTASGLPNAIPTAALCGVPPLAAIEAAFGGAEVLTVKLYVAETEGATNVRGLAVEPSVQLVKT